MIVKIADITFEWNDEKVKLVIQTHQVSFEEFCSVILDENSITKEDSIRLITGFKANKQQVREYQL